MYEYYVWLWWKIRSRKKLNVFKLFVIFLFFLFSCGYPDIDSVPDFKDLNITDKEAMDLCKINNSDNEQITECLKNNKTKN